MIEKLIKVIEADKDVVDAVIVRYKPESCIDMSFPHLNCVIERKVYFKSALRPTCMNNLEQEVFLKLIEAASKWEGAEEEIFRLDFNCDQEIYATTQKYRANVAVCNKKTKKLAKKTSGKKIKICEYIPDNTILLISVPRDLTSYAAVLVKDDKNNYLLDIINPDLIKVIKIYENLYENF